FLEVDLPGWIVPVRFASDFDMAAYLRLGRLVQVDRSHLTRAVHDFPMEHPTILAPLREVLGLHPTGPFIRVTPACPMPQFAEEQVIHPRKGAGTRCVSVI